MERSEQLGQLDAGVRIGPQIKQLSNAFHQCVNRSCEFSGLTGVQTWVVSYVVLHPEQAIYAKTLEQVLHLKHPTICGILQRLETKGFITFAVDETDRRCHRIIPTELALQAHRQAAEGLDAVERQLLAGFSPEEAAQFHDSLARAAANIGALGCAPGPEQQEETTC